MLGEDGAPVAVGDEAVTAAPRDLNEIPGNRRAAAAAAAADTLEMSKRAANITALLTLMRPAP